MVSESKPIGNTLTTSTVSDRKDSDNLGRNIGSKNKAMGFDEIHSSQDGIESTTKSFSDTHSEMPSPTAPKSDASILSNQQGLSISNRGISFLPVDAILSWPNLNAGFLTAFSSLQSLQGFSLFLKDLLNDTQSVPNWESLEKCYAYTMQIVPHICALDLYTTSECLESDLPVSNDSELSLASKTPVEKPTSPEPM